jgi:hypothetical protein
MVVPIYKQWTANLIRLQIVEQDNVIQLLAFFEDFSHADAMNFKLSSMDVFEKTDKGGKYGLKLVDAKFALPVDQRRGEGKMQKAEGRLTGWAGTKRRFVCLDEIEYPGEHDDILIQFETPEGKPRIHERHTSKLTRNSTRPLRRSIARRNYGAQVYRPEEDLNPSIQQRLQHLRHEPSTMKTASRHVHPSISFVIIFRVDTPRGTTLIFIQAIQALPKYHSTRRLGRARYDITVPSPQFLFSSLLVGLRRLCRQRQEHNVRLLWRIWAFGHLGIWYAMRAGRVEAQRVAIELRRCGCEYRDRRTGAIERVAYCVVLLRGSMMVMMVMVMATNRWLI